MKFFQKLPLFVIALCLLFVAVSALGFKVFAGGGRVVIQQLSQAEAGRSVQIKVQVYSAFGIGPSIGEQVQVRVFNGITGQVCSSPQMITDGNGQIFGNCWSPVNGEMEVYVYFPNSPSSVRNGSTMITFGSPVTGPIIPSPLPITSPINPSPTPVPVTPPVNPSPTPSVSPTPTPTPSPSPTPMPSPSPTPSPVAGFSLVPSESALTIKRNFPNISGRVSVLLKNQLTGQVITDQKGVSYAWTSSDRGVVQIAEEKVCISGITSPCPNLQAGLRGLQLGRSTLTVKAIKNGKVLATTTISVLVQK